MSNGARIDRRIRVVAVALIAGEAVEVEIELTRRRAERDDEARPAVVTARPFRRPGSGSITTPAATIALLCPVTVLAKSRRRDVLLRACLRQTHDVRHDADRRRPERDDEADRRTSAPPTIRRPGSGSMTDPCAIVALCRRRDPLRPSGSAAAIARLGRRLRLPDDVGHRERRRRRAPE